MNRVLFGLIGVIASIKFIYNLIGKGVWTWSIVAIIMLAVIGIAGGGFKRNERYNLQTN